MKIRRQIIVFDAADLATESSFWAGLLGGTVQADDDWHSVLVDGEWRLGVQLAPNHVSPRLAGGDTTAADASGPVGRRPPGRA